MAEYQRPQTWIGKEVIVARESSTQPELVKVENLTEWGIVCNYQLEAEVGEPVLIPWGAVSWVRLAVQEEADAPEEESQSS